MTDLAPRKLNDPAAFGRVGLLVGGDSAEREVSLDGGRAVSRAMERLGIRHETYDGPIRLFDAIFARQVERVFNLMHGPGGEDGAIQGALQLMQVPVTGSGVLGSALTMDKARSKWLMQRLDIPTAAFELLGRDDDPAAVLERLGLPLFVKPNGLGSSIGVSRVDAEDGLAPAVRLARQYGPEVIIEQAVTGKEYFAGVIGRSALPLIRIETPREFYDYEAKYQSGDTRYFCPCGLEADQESRLQALSFRVFEALQASGWGRVDFILDEAGQPWFLEVNTAPGMTDHSLVPQAAEQIGVGFDELVWRILETSL
jgi:D-alanine-D-alanine ligase